jgi:two-component system chemotaxis response regulator CheB
VLTALPADIAAAVFVVQHIPPYSRSNLDVVLQSHTQLRVKKARDGETIQHGVVYVAVADQHLLVEDVVVVSKGPRENRFRPAVDTLFRSAAHYYGDRVIGVILSGALNDGTSGMWAINRTGGVTVVQDPAQAMFPDMPNSVMEYTDVDHCLPSTEIGALLNRLVREAPQPATHRSDPELELLEMEVGIAKGDNGMRMGILEKGTRSPLACPECHGALTQFREGKLTRYRCHTGHAHTAESLLASVNENVEKSMWEVMRGMEESHLILEDMAGQLEQSGNQEAAADYRRRAREAQQRAVEVQRAIQGQTLRERALVG